MKPITTEQMSEADRKLDALLRWAHEDAQQFAERAQSVFLYH
jgi:hypothetical protein